MRAKNFWQESSTAGQTRKKKNTQQQQKKSDLRPVFPLARVLLQRFKQKFVEKHKISWAKNIYTYVHINLKIVS
jgi:hypothetical protein